MWNRISSFIRFLIANWYILVIILLVAFVFWGRSTESISANEDDDPVSESKTRLVEQKSLSFAAEAIDTLNPLASGSEDVYYITKLIYDGLFRFDDKLCPEPILADSYRINTEKAHISVTLRSGIKFHDGTALTADDVIFTVNAIKTIGKDSPYYLRAKKIKSIYKSSENTVEIYFNNNYNCSLDDLVFPVVSSSGYASATAFKNDLSGFKPIGTGPYMFKTFKEKKHLRLVPNEKYFGEVSDKSIYVRILPDKALAANMMEIEEVSCYVDNSSNRKTIANDKGFSVYDIPSNKVEFVVLNNKHTYLKDKSFRKAVLYAINQQKVLESAYMGDGILTDTVYYPGFMGVEDSHDVYSYDEKKARESLNEYGLSDTNGDAMYENSHGEKICLEILVNKSDSMRTKAAGIIRNCLISAGISANINAVSDKEYNSLIQNRAFDILVTGYTIGEEYDLRSLFNGKSEWKYNNYRVLNSVQKLDRLYSAEKYPEIYTEIKKAIIEDAVYYPLIYKQESLIGCGYFEAEKLPVFNDIYRYCGSWIRMKEKTED